ncbi:hypothetical protein AB7M16_003321 [Bradyrhizobium sp. USDA 372]
MISIAGPGGNQHFAVSKGESMPKAVDNDPGETPLDDPRQQTDMPTHRQGNSEKDQIDPKRPPLDLERWQKTNTH